MFDAAYSYLNQSDLHTEQVYAHFVEFMTTPFQISARPIAGARPC